MDNDKTSAQNTSQWNNTNAQGASHTRTRKQNRILRRQQAILCENLPFAAAEAYKLLRANLKFMLPPTGTHIMGITSSNRGEGKSTTSINLSYCFAQAGKRTLLIDGDMRLPSVAGRLDLPQAPGLSNLLAGLCEEKEALRVSKQLKNWYIMPAGDIPPNPSELLGSEKMQALLERFAKAFDIIIIDLPPIGIVSDALVVSTWTDGLMVVVRQNYTDRRALDDCVSSIEKFNVKFLGFVMTDVTIGETGYKSYKRYGKYSHKYGYGDDYSLRLKNSAANSSLETDKAFSDALHSGEEKFPNK